MDGRDCCGSCAAGTVEGSNQCDSKESQGQDCSMTGPRASFLLKLWDEHIATGEPGHCMVGLTSVCFRPREHCLAPCGWASGPTLVTSQHGFVSCSTVQLVELSSMARQPGLWTVDIVAPVLCTHQHDYGRLSKIGSFVGAHDLVLHNCCCSL
jgi:hypothetical protein